MKVLVLGAGVIGVTTAYFLRRDGHDVAVVERRPGPGLETSFANGGQISASHAEPWANPTAPLRLLRWLGKEDAPLLVRPLRWDPALWAWGLRFLANCTPARSRRNAERILRVAVYSRKVLQEICAAEPDLDFDRRRRGILQFFRSDEDLRRGRETAEIMAAAGCDCQVVDVEGCVAVEPALAAAKPKLRGGVFTPDDESGDAHKFTVGLAAVAASRGVDFRYGQAVERLLVEGGKVVGVSTAEGRIAAEATVVCLGSHSPQLVKPLGLRLPIYPAKGYSATLPIAADALAPEVSLIDEGLRIVYSRLGSRLRIAGTAEFAGYDERLDTDRARFILESALSLFPTLGSGAGAEFWTGLRPSTPDGVPVIGRTPYPGLFLNTGHGTLGWTMSAGSARLIADRIGGKTPAIETSGIGVDRFT